MTHHRGPRRRWTAGGWSAVAVAVLLGACSSDGETADTPDINESVSVQPVAEPDGDSLGLTEERILFGQSAALSGPAKELGRNMRLGILAAFDEVNAAGGVHGRVLELQSLDDAYEPEDAIVMTRHLIEQEQVFALIGAVGTPTSRSATPIARNAGVPYIAPFTGAAFLRDDEWDNIINLRASYNQETEEMVARLTEDLGITRISVMYQNDSFGRAGFRGTVAALERRDMELTSIGIYPRNTTAVKTALLDLRQGDPEAVIMIGAYEPVARLILWARRTGMDAVFMTVSFVGSNALAQELGPDGAGVLVTQVVPFPEDDSLPVVLSYLDALASHDPEAEPGFVSLEGYLAGRMVIAALQECGAEVDRSCLLDQLIDRGDFDIDGFKLQFGDGDNQGSDEVFLTVIGSDGRYHPVHTLHETVLWVTR
ncbi:MAG: ABC transporter substrate-binding protein [Acidimicrobiaceae bacterium]|nr:ABC transporter substrate-binding protein [Acidimicrobiaceae bacterium]MYF44457.1 ABC transporter substrate-binding protein [Acidimicrobiaceae bacterium]MYJ35057.1 ABC transporter substrate-binding protein [Acidimicrobiaceae bacterium]